MNDPQTTAPNRNRIASPKNPNPQYTGGGFGHNRWMFLALGSLTFGCLAVAGLVGMLVQQRITPMPLVEKAPAASAPVSLDTRLTDVKPTTPNIVESFNTNNYYGQKPTPAPVVKVEEPAPNQVVVVEPQRPVPQTVYIRPESAPPHPGDLTVVIVKPEVRPPEQRVIVIDERADRLRREHLERKAEWATRPASLAGSW